MEARTNFFLLRELYSLLMKNHCVMSWKSSLNFPNQDFEQNKMSPHRINLSFIEEPPDVFVTEYTYLKHPALYG